MDSNRQGSEGRRRRLTLVAFVVVALIPIIGAAIRLGHAGWQPEGDDAMIARRTMSVFSTQPPLTGQPSTAGNLFTLAHPPAPGGDADPAKPASQIDASHPGPLEYYLLAVPYRLGGWSPWALLAAVALLNGASVVVAVVFAWRRLGVVGAVAATVAVLVVAERLGTWNLARPLNASIAVLALLGGLVATWAALDGDRWAVPAAAACLSLVIQAHLGAAPLAAVILLLALAAPIWLRFFAQRFRVPKWLMSNHFGTRNSGTGARPMIATGLVLAVAWVLVLVEQVTADRGNLGRLAEVARLDVDRAGLRFGLAAVADQVARPVWPGVSPLPRISILGPIAFVPAVLQLLTVVLALVAAAWWARRSGARWLVRLLAVVAIAVAVPMLVLGRGPDEVRLGPAYQLTSLVAVSAFVAFALSATAATLARPFFVHSDPFLHHPERRTDPDARPARSSFTATHSCNTLNEEPTEPPGSTGATDSAQSPSGSRSATRRQSVAVAVAVLGVVAIMSATLGGPTYAADNLRTTRLADAIRAQIPKGTYKLAAQGTWAYLSSLDAVSVDLLRHGYDIRVVRLGTIPKEPQRRNLNVDAPTIVLASNGERPPNGRLLVDLAPLPRDPSWAGDLLTAVSQPSVTIRVTAASEVTPPDPSGSGGPQDPAGPTSPSRSTTPCADQVERMARRRDIAALRRDVVLAILSCSQGERRAALLRVSFPGLDQFWVDLLGSNMPAPFPLSGLAAYLVPAGK